MAATKVGRSFDNRGNTAPGAASAQQGSGSKPTITGQAKSANAVDGDNRSDRATTANPSVTVNTPTPTPPSVLNAAPWSNATRSAFQSGAKTVGPTTSDEDGETPPPASIFVDLPTAAGSSVVAPIMISMFDPSTFGGFDPSLFDEPGYAAPGASVASLAGDAPQSEEEVVAFVAGVVEQAARFLPLMFGGV